MATQVALYAASKVSVVQSMPPVIACTVDVLPRREVRRGVHGVVVGPPAAIVLDERVGVMRPLGRPLPRERIIALPRVREPPGDRTLRKVDRLLGDRAIVGLALLVGVRVSVVLVWGQRLAVVSWFGPLMRGDERVIHLDVIVEPQADREGDHDRGVFVAGVELLRDGDHGEEDLHLSRAALVLRRVPNESSRAVAAGQGDHGRHDDRRGVDRHRLRDDDDDDDARAREMCVDV
eukprot:31073-Pelagococcus_subviridis.AAC.16